MLKVCKSYFSHKFLHPWVDLFCINYYCGICLMVVILFFFLSIKKSCSFHHLLLILLFIYISMKLWKIIFILYVKTNMNIINFVTQFALNLAIQVRLPLMFFWPALLFQVHFNFPGTKRFSSFVTTWSPNISMMILHVQSVHFEVENWWVNVTGNYLLH